MPFCVYTSNWCSFTARYCSNDLESSITVQTKVRFAGSSLDGAVSAGIYTNVCWPNHIHNYTNRRVIIPSWLEGHLMPNFSLISTAEQEHVICTKPGVSLLSCVCSMVHFCC